MNQRTSESYLRAALLVAALVVSCVACASAPAAASQGAEEVHPLNKLRFGTGWILIGYLDSPSQLWATQLKHRLLKRRDARDSIVPVPGDVLEITASVNVEISNYRSLGEQDRLIAPTGKPFSRDDLTGVTLVPGTQVVVEEVVRDRVLYTEAIWARVTRPTR